MRWTFSGCLFHMCKLLPEDCTWLSVFKLELAALVFPLMQLKNASICNITCINYVSCQKQGFLVCICWKKGLKTKASYQFAEPVWRILLPPVVSVRIARSKSQRDHQKTECRSTGPACDTIFVEQGWAQLWWTLHSDKTLLCRSSHPDLLFSLGGDEVTAFSPHDWALMCVSWSKQACKVDTVI